jgi:CRP-like cAMP-binding protein
MTVSTLVEGLHALPYFDSLDDAQLEVLASQCQQRRCSANEIIFLEGEAPAGLYLIERGRVKIFKINPDGEEHIMHLLGAGNTFNDIASFDGQPNPANAAALTQVQLWLLPAPLLRQLLVSNSALALKIIKIFAGRVRMLVGQIEDLALYSVTIRLARFLLKQAEDPALSGPGVTRQAIAAHLATKPETISRALRSLEQAEAIRFDRHRIVIVNERLLRTIAAL